MFAASKSGSADAKDPQFNYVTMLLHGNGTNGAQNNTFVDSSTNNFTITRNGNTTQGTFSPYGSNWSNYFSSGNSLSTASSSAFNCTGDFTLEAWIFPTSAWASAGSYNPILFVSGTGLYFGQNSAGVGLRQSSTANIISYGTSPTLNVWTHVAIVRSGTTITMYYNGTSVATATSSATFSTGTSTIANDGSYSYTGYVSNLRLVKGTAVYTGSFTPSATPLTAITNTTFLTCQSNRFVDNSTSALALTPSGSPSVQRFSPFSPTSAYSTSVIGGSGYFDGSGDYLSAPTTSGQLGSGDFTIECWSYLISKVSIYPCIWGNYTSFTTGSLAIFAGHNSGTTTKYNVAINGTFPAIQSTDSIIYNQWTHLALVRSGTTITLYVNGVANGTLTSSATLNGTSGTSYIGTAGDDITNGYINGYLSNVRVVKGTAVYTSGFTPPTTPLTAVTNTSLLLSYTNAGILDNAEMNDLETVGNAQVSTSVKKFGTGSMYFDGSGDNLSVLPSAGALGSGDWTVEFWWQWTSATGDYQTVVSKGIVGGTPANGSWSFGPYQQANNIWFAYYNGGFTDVSASATLNDGAWHHMAASRQGTSLRLFADGVLKVTATLPSNLDFGPSTSDPFLVGYNSRNARYINGYVDDLRITKGVARYTATFTPPTAAFPDKG